MTPMYVQIRKNYETTPDEDGYHDEYYTQRDLYMWDDLLIDLTEGAESNLEIGETFLIHAPKPGFYIWSMDKILNHR